jgi:hypothetical protein
MKPVNNSHMVVAEEAAEDVEVVVVAPEVVAVPASNVEKRVTSQETAPRNSHLVATLEEVVADREEEAVKPDLELVTNVEKKVTTLVTVLRRRKEKEATPVVVEEVAVLSEVKDPELATSVEKKVTTLVTVPLSSLLDTVVAVVVLSVDPNPELVMSAEKKDITFATVPRKKDRAVVATTPASSATPATRWVTCLVTAPKDASPDKEVVTASTATSLVTWPETALKVVILVVAVEVVSVEETDLPARATDVERRDISSPIAPSLTPEVKRTKRSDHLTLSASAT